MRAKDQDRAQATGLPGAGRRVQSALALAALLIGTAAHGEAPPQRLLLDSATDTSCWGADNGGEFPGATVNLDAVKDADRGRVLEARCLFAGDSRYGGAHWYGDIQHGQALGFWIKLMDRDGATVRVRDDTGQELLGGITAKRGQWTQVEVPLKPESFGAHWQGANDGQLHFPLRAFLIAVGRGPEQATLRVANLYVLTAQVAAAERWRLSLRPRPSCGVAFRGEAADYVAQVANRLEAPGRADVSMSCQGVAPGDERPHFCSASLSLKGWQQTEVPVRLVTGHLGYWRVRAELRELSLGSRPGPGPAQPPLLTADSGLAVVPRPRHYRRAAPDCYFGLQSVPDMEVAERLGAKSIREAPGWRWAEPTPGNVLWRQYLDGLVDRCGEHQMELLLTLQAIAPSWATWDDPARPNLRDLPAPDKLPAWERFVREVAARYRGRVAAYEVQNEPDLTCWYQPGLSMAEGLGVYERLLRAAHDGLKAGDPQATVAGLDVSGGDFDGGLGFTRAMLDRAAPCLDLYTGHPYSGTRYFGPGQHPIWPLANRMGEKCAQALDLLSAHGRVRRMWIGELGWGLDVTADPLGPYSLDFAGCMAQALIVGKSVPGVDKFLWFTLQGCNEGGYEYGLLRGQPSYPLPAALAYSACAYLLDATRPVELKSVASGVWRASFVCDQRQELVVAWFTEGEPVLLRPPAAAPAGQWRDSFLQSPPRSSVPVGRLPVYWVLPLGAAGPRPAWLDQVRVTAAQPVEINQVFLPDTRHLAVALTNHTNLAQRVEVRAGSSRLALQLPAGADRQPVQIALAAPVASSGAVELPVTVTAGGARQERTLKLNLTPLPPPPPGLRMDGDLSEWRARPAFRLASRQDVLPPDPGVGWSGPEDLSVSAYLAADRKALVFAAEVTDPTHVAPSIGPDDFWNSDSVQIAVDPTGDSLEGFDADDREVGFVLAPDGPRAFLTYPVPRRRLELPLAIVRRGTVTTYEAAIPWSALGLPEPRTGQVMALNFIVNQNNGQGRAYWMGLTPGIGESKSPAAYRRFVVTAGAP